MKKTFYEVDLNIPAGPLIVFLRAEIHKKRRSPLVLIRYSFKGEEPVNGFRLDLDKQVFLDRPFENDEVQQQYINQAIPEIVKRIVHPTAF